ncbi:MAG TPA: glycosyltransferase [Rhizobacter sp.]|nr:glycosyltransferase [Rhizobacter sp.]
MWSRGERFVVGNLCRHNNLAGAQMTPVSHEARPMPARSVSVVIPSRDGRDTLKRALDSIVPGAQHVHEVIVVFSNSPAEFKAYCEALLPRYANAFAARALDSGAASNGAIARNVGMQAAAAPLLALLDDDDEWLPNKLSVYLEHIARLSLSGDFVLFSQVVSCREDRSAWRLFPSVSYDGGRFSDFVLSPLGGAQTSSLLLPTRLAQRVGFDPSLVRHQDYDFCLRLEEAGARFVGIEQPLAYWYQRGNGVEKGGTFDFCTAWVQKNAHRISRAAYIGYIEKDMFTVARISKRMNDFFAFQRMNLTRREIAGSLWRLARRAVKSARRRLSPEAGAFVSR